MSAAGTPTWYETFESDWKTQLRAVKDRWVNLADEDAVTEIVFQVGRQVVTAERIIRRVPVAEIMKLDVPGGLGPTMGDVIQDSILDPMGDVVAAWALNLWEPPEVTDGEGQ